MKNNTDSNININLYNYIIIDSIYSYKYLQTKKIKKNIKIISFNPTLLLNKSLNILSPEKNFNPKDFINLGNITYKYSGLIFDKIYSKTKDKHLAIWMARYLISIQNTLYRAARLKEIISNQKTLIIELDLNDKRLNNSLNGDLNKFMNTIYNCDIKYIKHIANDTNRLARDPKSSLWERLKFEGATSIIYRLCTIICKPISKYWPGKKFYYGHENSLLKKIGLKLFFKGYMMLEFPKNIISDKKFTENKELLSIFKCINPIIKLYQEEILNDKLSNYRSLFFDINIKRYLYNYLNAKLYWEKEFLKGGQKNIIACLIGFPSTALELSYTFIAKKHKVVTASFQHAISKEISEDILSIDSIYESNITDYYFVYNSNVINNSIKSRFHSSSDMVIGIPNDLKKLNIRKSNDKIFPPVLYASTNLYTGNRGIPGRAGSSDIDKASFEIDIIKNILGKIPHKVHYKPYFSKRYTGPPIEWNYINSQSNIILNKDEIDLRYIINKSKVIITSRATSTLGWCIHASKPLIYIENMDNRLNDKIRAIFKKSLFYFDVYETDWKDDLKKLLSKNITKIEKDWNKMSKNREKYLYPYFDDSCNNAHESCVKTLIN